MPAIDLAEAGLDNALVAVVGGTWSLVSHAQVVGFLGRFYAIRADEVEVKRDSRADFLFVFSSRQLTNQVLHTPPAQGDDFLLVFQRWRHQTGTLFKPFKCKVLLAVSSIPAHVWSVEVVQAILGSSCLVLESSP
jgi:hypothetical protein